MRRVLVTLVAVAAAAPAAVALAWVLTGGHHGAARGAVIRYARCHYDRRSNRVIAMATLTNPNGSAVSFAVGARYIVQVPQGHGGLGHRRWAMIGFGIIPDRRRPLPLRIDGGRHLWWVARTPPIRHPPVSGERALCQFSGVAPLPKSAGQHD
jgi:hypothetical protein